MSQIDSVYLVWASKVFQILRAVHELDDVTGVIKPSLSEITCAIYTDAINETLLEPGCLSLAELHLALDDNYGFKVVDQFSQKFLDDHCQELEFQIDARCACLVEIVETKNKHRLRYKPRSKTVSSFMVQYLHRTAKDFLEHPTRWSEVLDRTQEISFSPCFSLMRSHYLLLHRVLQDPRYQFKEHSLGTECIRAAASNILGLASCLDAEGKFGRRELSLLYDLKQTFDLEETLGGTELERNDGIMFQRSIIPPKLKNGIMSCALMLNLSEFISAQLQDAFNHEDDPTNRETTCTILLHDLVDKFCSISGTAPPTFNLRLVSALIRNGADVNYEPSSDTETINTWKIFLSTAIVYTYPEARYQALKPDALALMELFLSAGADPNIFKSYSCLSVEDFFEEYVRPIYTEAVHQPQINAVQNLWSRKTEISPTNITDQTSSSQTSRPPRLLLSQPADEAEDLDPPNSTFRTSMEADAPKKQTWLRRTIIALKSKWLQNTPAPTSPSQLTLRRGATWRNTDPRIEEAFVTEGSLASLYSIVCTTLRNVVAIFQKYDIGLLTTRYVELQL